MCLSVLVLVPLRIDRVEKYRSGTSFNMRTWLGCATPWRARRGLRRSLAQPHNASAHRKQQELPRRTLCADQNTWSEALTVVRKKKEKNTFLMLHRLYFWRLRITLCHLYHVF